MRTRTTLTLLLACVATILATAAPAEGQLRRIRRAAQQAVESEVDRQIARLLQEAIRCAISDPTCDNEARSGGEEVIYTDGSGEVIVDDDGVPITDRDEAAKRAGYDTSADAEPPMVKPGEGAWANYDFVPGEIVLFYDDFSNDRVGDFPRRWSLTAGNWEVVEWQGGRYLRATAGGQVEIPLPKTLPERFTVEFPVSVDHGNAYVRVTTDDAWYGTRAYAGSSAVVEWGRAGLRPVKDEGPTTLGPVEHRFDRDGLATFRVMADGDYMKLYLDENRVTNAPNAVFPRTDRLVIAVGSASPANPILIGPVRIGEGGLDLYDRLAEEGRVATQGILFDIDSARIRPESTPTLEEIGTMLQEHPELRIRIEGHTDSTGDDAHNQTLSEERAAAVRGFLMESYGVDGSRLEAQGFGETSPVDSNDTPEGRQNNRRVELVRLG